MDSTVSMLSVLGIAILMIIVLSIKFRIHAFISLLAACFLIAFATGMPLDKIGKSIEVGMGGTLGFLAPILALGAIIGKMMEISGGAEKLSRTLISSWSVLSLLILRSGRISRRGVVRAE